MSCSWARKAEDELLGREADVGRGDSSGLNGYSGSTYAPAGRRARASGRVAMITPPLARVYGVGIYPAMRCRHRLRRHAASSPPAREAARFDKKFFREGVRPFIAGSRPSRCKVSWTRVGAVRKASYRSGVAS